MFIQLVAASCLALATGDFAPAPSNDGGLSTLRAWAESASGSISGIDVERKMFTLNTKSGNIEVKVTDTTEFTLDGKKSTMAESLKAGREATVSHDNRTASRVEVKSA